MPYISQVAARSSHTPLFPPDERLPPLRRDADIIDLRWPWMACEPDLIEKVAWLPIHVNGLSHLLQSVSLPSTHPPSLNHAHHHENRITLSSSATPAVRLTNTRVGADPVELGRSIRIYR